MHEMGVAQQIADIVLASIPEDLSDPKVRIVNLKIGKLAAVVEHSLRFCFEIIAKASPLEGAELAIEHIPVTVRCRDCHHQWEVSGAVFQCPACREGAVDLITGRELEVVSLELAD